MYNFLVLYKEKMQLQGDLLEHAKTDQIAIFTIYNKIFTSKKIGKLVFNKLKHKKKSNLNRYPFQIIIGKGKLRK